MLTHPLTESFDGGSEGGEALFDGVSFGESGMPAGPLHIGGYVFVGLEPGDDGLDEGSFEFDKLEELSITDCNSRNTKCSQRSSKGG